MPSKLTESKSKLKSKTTTPETTVEQQLENLTAINTNSDSSSSSNTSSSSNFNTATFNNHEGLKFPSFDPAQFLANDLFSNSSTLPETDKLVADQAIKSIQNKPETLRLVSANLTLNADTLKTGALSEKMSQAGIDYSSAKIGTDIKLVGLESQKVNLAIAGSKLGQVSEKLSHENITLEGMKLETDQRRRFWQEKYALGESRINQVTLAKHELDARIGAIEAEVIGVIE